MPPKDKDVVAGPWGMLIFAFLIVATALVCWSFVRQMRKTAAAQQAGVFGPVDGESAPSDPE